jgi:uncharacterized protein DUF5658
LREVMAVMAGAGRLSGRGSVALTAKTQTLTPKLSAARGPILRFRLAALLAAQLFDFGTFTLMIGKHGIAAEVNPLVAQGYATYGFPVLILVKLALVVLLGSIVVLLARDLPNRPAIRGFAATITVLAVAAGLIGGISNVLAG